MRKKLGARDHWDVRLRYPDDEIEKAENLFFPCTGLPMANWRIVVMPWYAVTGKLNLPFGDVPMQCNAIE